jgi:galactokinase
MTLDTRSLERHYLPLPPNVRVLVCNTMVKHQLASSEYNARRADCEAGVAVVAKRNPRVRALRDVTLVQLDAVAVQMPERVYRRCRHVIGENARVEVAAIALGDQDFEMFGRMVDASHHSLRDDYEVSCAELDTMVTIARSLDGVHGARMTGAGFGGCAIALADAGAVDRLQQEIADRYEAATRVRPDIWVCAAGPGVSTVPVRATHT